MGSIRSNNSVKRCNWGFWQSLGLIGFGYWYNGLRGSENNCFVRNFINACGYSCFISGALQVGSDKIGTFLLPVAYQWFGILGLVVFMLGRALIFEYWLSSEELTATPNL